MPLNVDNWRGLGTLVTDLCGRRRLWLDTEDGEVYDTLGPVTARGGSPLARTEDLVLVVGEWILCMAERDGPIAYQSIHPDLREVLYQLVAGGIAISDDDEASLIR